MSMLSASLRLVAATLLVCVAGYTTAILGVAQLFPDTAAGHLVKAADGRVVGSRQIAQAFERPEYFWPRPSAAGANGYDATAAAGSNKSPTSEALTDRARALAESYGATADRPLPADLVTASGAGLDPHISVRAAVYQANRVAAARGIPVSEVELLIERHAFAPGGILTSDRLVNVLLINLAMDGEWPKGAAARHD